MIEHVACLCCFFTTELLCHAIDDWSIIAFMSLHLIDFFMVEYVVVGFSCDLSWMCSLLCLCLTGFASLSICGRERRRFLLPSPCPVELWWSSMSPLSLMNCWSTCASNTDVSTYELHINQCIQYRCMCPWCLYIYSAWCRQCGQEQHGAKKVQGECGMNCYPPFDTYLTPIWHPIALLHPSDIHLWLWAAVLIMEASWHVACHFDHRSARSRTLSHMSSTPCLPTICATVCLCWLCDRLCSFSLFSVSTHLRWNPLHLLDRFCYYIWCFVHVLEFVLEDVQHCTGSVRGM